MSEWKFVTSTAPVTTLHYQYYSMTFNAAEQRNTSLSVYTASGAFTTVDIAKMSPSHVTVRLHVPAKCEKMKTVLSTYYRMFSHILVEMQN